MQRVRESWKELDKMTGIRRNPDISKSWKWRGEETEERSHSTLHVGAGAGDGTLLIRQRMR